MKKRVQKTTEADKGAVIGDFDKVSVEIWGYQWKAYQRAAAILQKLGCDPDDTPEHLLRELALLDDVQNIVELFVDGVDMPRKKQKALRDKWLSEKDALLVEG